MIATGKSDRPVIILTPNHDLWRKTQLQDKGRSALGNHLP
jgi:hypothetical protein